MTAHVKDAGAWKTLTGLYAKTAGAWATVLEGWVKDAGAWKQFYSSGGGGGGGGGGSVILSPSPADFFRQLYNYNGTGYVSGTVGATPSGFTSPTYAWTRVSGASSSGAFSVSGGSTGSSIVIGATIPVFVDATETWRCTVTESGTSNSAYADVVVNLECENLS